MLREIAAGIPDLQEDDIRRLEEIAVQLPLMAELTGSDVFIDCFPSEKEAVVAAQAGPSEGRSSYTGSVIGQPALPEKEPAVFRARELGAPVRDIKAITQENKSVRQFVVPLKDGNGRVIAVLLQEKDISEDLQRERKYQMLARGAEADFLQAPEIEKEESSTGTMFLREVNHRVKNSLQLVASILNMQSRRCADASAAELLRENAVRVLSIAASHDIITNTKELETIEIGRLLEKLSQNLQTLVPEQKRIRIETEGAGLQLKGEIAGYAAMVVNELVVNAIEHAFQNKEEGIVRITCAPGTLYHTITVADDGDGFPQKDRGTWGLGLRIAEATVREHLHGDMRISSGKNGTRISFDLEA